MSSPPLPAEITNEPQYATLADHEFIDTKKESTTTFAIDVDRASYTNVRRFLTAGLVPPPNAVRVEEMLNYFAYAYPQPSGAHPFSITTEVASCPWSVAIVVYAGAAGLALPSTSGADKQSIIGALDRLKAGGSTAGAQGIQLAYDVAKQNFIDGGNNRVILATDGDFNVGITSRDDLLQLIEQKRDDGIYLTTLGVGDDNYNDARMEMLADHGNGNYASLDNGKEAEKVFVRELTGTLVTIAKDVKVQLEFNPALVHSYRQIGYEDRALENKDFDDDTKDGGELGAVRNAIRTDQNAGRR